VTKNKYSTENKYDWKLHHKNKPTKNKHYCLKLIYAIKLMAHKIIV